MKRLLIFAVILILCLLAYKKATSIQFLAVEPTSSEISVEKTSVQNNQPIQATQIERQPAVVEMIPQMEPAPIPSDLGPVTLVCKTIVSYCKNSNERDEFIKIIESAYKKNFDREMEDQFLVRCLVDRPSDCQGEEAFSESHFTEDELRDVHVGAKTWLKDDIQFKMKDDQYLRKFQAIEALSEQKPILSDDFFEESVSESGN